jgi:hypothetical protein
MGAVDWDSLLWQGQPPYSKGSSAAWPPGSPGSGGWDRQGGWTSHTFGSEFWREFSGSVHVLCLSEVKYAMMAQSVVGVPGAIPLLCNLSTTVNLGMDTDEVAEVRPLSPLTHSIGACSACASLAELSQHVVQHNLGMFSQCLGICSASTVFSSFRQVAARYHA